MVTTSDAGGFVSQSDQPLYNVKAVCQRTGVSAATLRAWEHRYGVPKPNRTENGYRLYSEQDIALLIWLRQQIEQGMAISHAVHQWQLLLADNAQPSSPNRLFESAPETPVPVRGVRSPDLLRQELIQALITGDERVAEGLLSEALALYTLETALLHVLHGAVTALRAERQANTISSGTEHAGLSYILQRLTNISQFLPQPTFTDKAVITIGFSSERSEVDLLILGILLRRRGLLVTHLGADLDPRMLEPALAPLNAGLVVFYASDPKNVARLAELNLTNGQETVPVVCCGQVPSTESDRDSQASHVYYVGPDLHEAAQQISTLLAGHSQAGSNHLRKGR